MVNRTIVVTGATGRQGGATLRALEGKGFRLRAVTRKPDSDGAKALASRGIDVVQGDLDDEPSIVRALAGAWGVFSVQNTWEAGVEREEVQGKRLARVARDEGVEHFVYTSVGSADRETGIPHFDNKARIEDTVRSLKFPSHVILRPVFFMENLVSPWFLTGDVLHTALRPTTVLQMIASEDIGQYGARAFVDAVALNGREIDLAGDERTMLDVVRVFSDALGREISFQPTPIEDVRAGSEDFATMLEWFERVGYDVDIAGLEREFGIPPTKLEAWARTLP
jgi:uncharacterized protein YbjT (DUF2867 family)